METRITQSRVDRCLDTIEAICESKRLVWCLIGFTQLSAAVKGDSYRRHGFDHLVVLADKMDRAAALNLERRIQEAIFGDLTGLLFDKYHPKKRKKGIHLPSWGGSPRDASIPGCSVYMVWWERQISN